MANFISPTRPYRLSQAAWLPRRQTQDEVTAWNYDAMGNWLGYTNDALSQTRQFNKVNEITSLAGPGGAITPLYDPTGNMTTMPAVGDPSVPPWTTAQTLKWDAWNRLVKVSEGPTTIAEYSYDALFRRITKTVGSPGSTTTRRFYYNDQWQILEEYVGTATNPESRYWYGLRGLRDINDINDINDIARRQRYSTGTTLQDDLYALRETMNVVALAAPGGTVTQRTAYDAFGNARFLSSSFTTGSNAANWTLLFHAHYSEAETGFYQMRFRFYNSSIGVWLSRDLIHEVPDYNLLLFVVNSPLINYDALGLKKCCVIDGPSYRPAGNQTAVLDLAARVTRAELFIHANFKHDPASGCCCECCEVRQYIKSKTGDIAPHFLSGGKKEHGTKIEAAPIKTESGTDTEGSLERGRKANDTRMRIGRQIQRCVYAGNDSPSKDAMRKTVIIFLLVVVDVCKKSGSKTVKAGDQKTVTFPDKRKKVKRHIENNGGVES